MESMIQPSNINAFLLNELSDIHFYPEILITIMNNEIIDENALITHLKQKYLIMRGTKDDTIHEKIKDLREYFDVIYIDDKRGFKIRPHFSNYMDTDYNKLNFKFFKYIKKLFGGKWGIFTKNSSLILFLTFLNENEHIIIQKDPTSTKIVDDFNNFLEEINATPKAAQNKPIKWNNNKLRNLFEIYKQIGIIQAINETYVVFGNPIFFALLLDDLCFNLKDSIKDSNPYYSVEEFLKIFDEEYFFLTELHFQEKNLSNLVSKILLKLEQLKKIELLNSSDYRVFNLPSNREVNHLKILF